MDHTESVKSLFTGMVPQHVSGSLCLSLAQILDMKTEIKSIGPSIFLLGNNIKQNNKML